MAIQSQLQSELEEYRDQRSLSNRAELRREKHHPTKVLARNLTAVGEPKPTVEHHPIILFLGKGNIKTSRL